jgi:hypothetical protein
MRSLTYLSFGAGVQSTALLVLSAKGLLDCPRADAVIFADTGDEPHWVYEHLETMTAWAKQRGMPVYRVSRGCLSADVRDRLTGKKSRFAAIPAFTLGEDGRAAPLRRQCTSEYKIEVIEKKVRELLGFAKGEKIPGKGEAHCLVGISFDERIRMRDAMTPWITNHYPLVDAKLNRQGCIRILEEHGVPVPQKSSCVFCPFHSDSYWINLRDSHPEEFARAVAFDKVVRDMSMSGIEQPIFLHRSLKPLDEVKFDNHPELFANDCSGHCGV